MDTTTVMQIIKMLDSSVNHYEDLTCLDEYEIGAKWALSTFRDHLQSFIEGQLNAVENQTVE